jgi:DNA-directed RNA polymerase subunit RPC12/RpoP
MSKLFKYKCNNCGCEFHSNKECLVCIRCESKRLELLEEKKFQDNTNKYEFSIFKEEPIFELDELEDFEEEGF